MRSLGRRVMRRGAEMGRALLATVLAVVLACAGLVGCGGPEQPQRGYQGTDGTVVVSLGDSYSSGEGNPPFYGQDSDDKISDQDWLAHRSTRSWPGKLVVNNGTALLSDNKANLDNLSGTSGDGVDWYFFASSGAETKDILTELQEKEYGYDTNTGKHTTASRVAVAPLGGSIGIVHLTAYIDNQLQSLQSVAAANGGSVDYVTMSIGGNDLGFTDVVTSCVLSNRFTNFRGVRNELADAVEKYHNEVRANIKETYIEVSSAVGPDGYVIIAGYPTLLDAEDDHGGFFHHSESLMINNKVEWFDAQLELLVREVNAENGGSRAQLVYVSVIEEFRGHEAYTSDPYINEVMIGAQSEDLRDTIASAYSVHPNNDGTDAYARCVQEAINQIEGGSGEAADEGETQPGAAPSTNDKDVALVLDVSGSMSGQPIEETMNAAGQFVDLAIDNGAECAVVTYDNWAYALSGFSSDAAALRSLVLNLSAGGGTNIEAGLAEAAALLEGRSDDDRYIVLMSDGEPTTGLEGDELIAYAESIRDPDGDGVDDVLIYTLGFNEGASGQALLRGIASDGCFYSVNNAEDLEGFFTDIINSINGVRYMYVRVECPVDVTVSYGGETLSSAGETPSTRTSFGSLTFEDEVLEDGTEAESDDPVKVLRLREGASYEISISGYGTGTMDYSIGFIDDEGRYSDFRTFSDIAVTSRTEATTTAEVAEATLFQIDDDGDGVFDRTLRAAANEEGALVDNSGIVTAILAVYAVVFALIVALLIRSLLRRRRLA